MKIEEMEQSLELLNNIKDFFMNIEDTEKKLLTELSRKEAEFCDIRHEIELSDLNAIENARIYKQEKNVLKERRVIKNKIELINTMKGYSKKFIEKGICVETKTTIKNIETLKSNQQHYEYTPRILKDLKCAKKKGK